jgi:hypothetical protein
MRFILWVILWILYLPFFVLKKIVLSIESTISALEDEGKEFRDELLEEYSKKEILLGTVETIGGIIGLLVVLCAIILIR